MYTRGRCLNISVITPWNRLRKQGKRRRRKKILGLSHGGTQSRTIKEEIKDKSKKKKNLEGGGELMIPTTTNRRSGYILIFTSSHVLCAFHSFNHVCFLPKVFFFYFNFNFNRPQNGGAKLTEKWGHSRRAFVFFRSHFFGNTGPDTPTTVGYATSRVVLCDEMEFLVQFFKEENHVREEDDRHQLDITPGVIQVCHTFLHESSVAGKKIRVFEFLVHLSGSRFGAFSVT